MDRKLEQLASYDAGNNGRRVSLINARPRSIPFQNTATPTQVDDTDSAIITISERPFVLNQIQLTSITPSGIDALPMAFFMSFNVYDQDQMGLFGARNPRASTIFGPCIQVSATQFTSVAYALQPVKVFAPKTRIKLEWSNNNTFTTNALGFEMFLDGIEVLGYDMPDDGNTEELRDLVEELLEKRVR